MAENLEGKKFTLRLRIDEEKNKVVLVEAGKDFVDVLFSLLTMPMSTNVRLLEENQKAKVGCFSNLYKSVLDMEIENFETEACKEILVNPRSVKEVKCKKLKLNMNPTDDLKYFKCRNFSSCNLCSNFSSSLCACGELMNQEIGLSEDGHVQDDGVFVRGWSSFIITDDLKVLVDSIGPVLETLSKLGYCDVSKLGELLLDVGLEEILTLVQYMFISNTPVTDTFLKKQSVEDLNKKFVGLIQYIDRKIDGKESQEFTFDALVRKHDEKILYVECGQDLVDLLCTFLALPLEYSYDLFPLGCIHNLRGSFKDLSVDDDDDSDSKCVLPYYYKCGKKMSDFTTEMPPVYYRYRNSNPSQSEYSLTTYPYRYPLYRKDRLVPVTLIDPKSHGGDQSENGSGFVKRGTRFMVSDDLIITPMNPLHTSICSLNKLQIKADDLDVQVFRIYEQEAKWLLRASFVSSSAFNTAFWYQGEEI